MFKLFKHHVKNMGASVASRLSLASDSVTYFIIGLFTIAGSLFIIPIQGMSVASSKGFITLFLVLIALLIYGIHVLRLGEIRLPFHWFFAFLAGIPIVGFVGSLLAPSFSMSLWGYGFETTSWIFGLVFVGLLFFSYRTIASYDRLTMLYGGILLAFLVTIGVQIARFFMGPAAANLGVLWTSTATLVGSWSDLAIFLGFIVLFSVVTLELGGLKRSVNWIIGTFGVLATLVLAFMNIKIVWIIIGLVALLFALYTFSFAYWDRETKTYHKGNRIPIATLGLFMVAVVCILFGNNLNGIANRYQNITFNDVRPSLTTTASVAGKSLLHNFATGYGPNTFSSVWSLVKPASISGTNIAGIDFSSGVGFVPTQIATGGILGAIVWIGAFVGLFWILIRRLAVGFENPMDRYFLVSLGLLITYLAFLAWAYVPGTYILGLLAVLTGAFMALGGGSLIKIKTFSFIKDPRASFFGILGITALIVVTIVGIYIGARKFTSFIHYANGLVLLNQGNNTESSNRFVRAANLAKHDIYHQQLANLAVGELGTIMSSGNTAPSATLSAQAEQVMGIALGHAQAAVDANPGSYRNWILLGDTYRFMVTLGVADAADKARTAYNEAIDRSPRDTTLPLYLARLAVTEKNIPQALEIITNSINQYPTADAYVLRAQIELEQGKTTDAIISMKQATITDPYNAGLHYQFGLLLFTEKKYSDAIVQFQNTIVLNRNFGQAYLYLGVAYERSGSVDEANKIYDFLKSQDPSAGELIQKIKTANGEAPQLDDPEAVGDTDADGTLAPKTKKP